MDTWEMNLLKMTAQGVILAGSNYMTRQDDLKLILLERSEEDKRARRRRRMEMAIFLTEKEQLTFSKTDSIMAVRRKNMCEIQEAKSSNIEELYEMVRPISKGFASALRNYFCAPSDKELYYRVKAYSMRLAHEEKLKILECVLELAKLNQLSDERFKLLMLLLNDL